MGDLDGEGLRLCSAAKGPNVPLPRSLGKVNRVATNRVLGLLGGKLRPFAILTHTGRRSGNTYRTTLWAFRKGESVAVALTYGKEVDWARNVLATGSFQIDLGGQKLTMSNPRVVGDDMGRPMMPPAVRAALPLMGVHDYLVADIIRSER